MKNYHGKDLASADWLTTHFRAKSDQRIRQLIQLPIVKGDRVLDICCGPGIFSRYFLVMAGENGYIHCIDNDPINIDNAELNLGNTGLLNWSTQCTDMTAAFSMAAEFNVIIIFNALCYLENPFEYVSNLCKVAKQGTRIILKDFDLGYIQFNGLNVNDWAHLISKAMISNYSKNPLPYDNFLGRKIHQMHQNSGCIRYENFIWSQNLNFPFSDSSRKYIWENIRSLLDQARFLNTNPDYVRLYATFNNIDGSFYLDQESFMLESEFLTILTM